MYNVGRLILDVLFGPALLGRLRGDLVPLLTRLDWVGQVTPAAVTQAAQEQAQSRDNPPPPPFSLSPVLLGSSVVLGSELGLGYHDQHNWLVAHRLASLFAPGAQPEGVVSALETLLPLAHRLLTLDERGTGCEDVVGVLESVVEVLDLPFTHRAMGRGSLTLDSPLWPSCSYHLEDLEDRVIPHGMATVTPRYVDAQVHKRMMEQQQQAQEQAQQQEAWEGVEAEAEAEQQQQVPPQWHHPLTLSEVKLLAEGGWFITGSRVVGPAGQSCLVAGFMVHKVLAALL
jgi:hypothetical protein